MVAKMAEYIERDKVLEAILNLPPKMDEQGYGWLGRMGVWQMLSDFPSADVQPVVHCKDCKHRDPEDRKCDCGELARAGCIFPVKDDYFCAYGARKDSKP